MRTPSIWAILVLVVVVLLLFGARRLPDVAASVGKSLKIFKKEIKDLTDDDAPRPVPYTGSDPVPGTRTAPAPAPTPDEYRTT